jgi:hypothetical protein
MFDALNPNNIPPQAEVIAHYVDVISPANAALRWPGKVLVSIARNAQERARVADVENTDLTPQQLPGWVTWQRQNGMEHPWGYVNRDNWPACREECNRQGVAEPLWWVAWPGAGGVIPPGAIAVQYAFEGTYDVSLVADFVPGLDQPPAPQPGPRTWGDTVKSYRGTVQSGGGNGWAPLPDGVAPESVISAVIDQQKPDAPGVGYRRVPLLSGLATGPNTNSGKAELVFENPADFVEPDGGFGFTLWTNEG